MVKGISLTRKSFFSRKKSQSLIFCWKYRLKVLIDSKITKWYFSVLEPRSIIKVSSKYHDFHFFFTRYFDFIFFFTSFFIRFYFVFDVLIQNYNQSSHWHWVPKFRLSIWALDAHGTGSQCPSLVLSMPTTCSLSARLMGTDRPLNGLWQTILWTLFLVQLVSVFYLIPSLYWHTL